MQYYQCDQYPIEFILSENIDKHFDSHNHVGHYVISVVMQGTAIVCLENKESICYRGDVFVIPPYAVHSIRQGRDARLMSMCIGTDFIEKNDLETARDFVRELLRNAVEQRVFGREQGEKLLTSMQEIYHLRDNGREEIDAGIKNLVDIITRRPEQELSIETLAAEMGFYDQSHFDKAFRKIVGISPSEYVQSKRRIKQVT